MNQVLESLRLIDSAICIVGVCTPEPPISRYAIQNRSLSAVTVPMHLKSYVLTRRFIHASSMRLFVLASFNAYVFSHILMVSALTFAPAKVTLSRHDAQRDGSGLGIKPRGQRGCRWTVIPAKHELSEAQRDPSARLPLG